MDSTIKVQQIEDKDEYFRIHYDITVSNEKLRRTLVIEPFDISTTTESDVVDLIVSNEDDDEVNQELARIKESKAGRYYPDASGNLVPFGGSEIKRWSPNGVAYEVGDLVLYKGKLKQVTQAHTSQSDWTPDVALSLFANVQILGNDTPPQWIQPDGAGGPNLPYSNNVVVTHNGSYWQSDVDNNVWEPGVSQWTEVEKDADGNWVAV